MSNSPLETPISDIHREKWDLNLIPNLSGRVALVTGAAGTGSIGFNIAHQLALKGAKVYIGARTAEKAQVAIEAILSTSQSISKQNLKAFVAELGDLKQVKAASNKVVAEESRLDLLIHNAAMLAEPLVLDSNGISTSIVVNHLAPFVITKTLLPLLKSATTQSLDVRVVTISSFAHTFVSGPVKFDSKESFNIDFGSKDSQMANLLRYGYSKLANVLFAKQLQKKLYEDGANIISVSLHPGSVLTAGALDYASRYDAENILDGAITPLEGAITPLFAATAPEVQADKAKYAGAYLIPFGVVSPTDESEDAKNPALAEELWNTSEKIVAEVFGN